MRSRYPTLPAAYLIFRRKDGKVLLMRRQNTGYKDGWYGLPSGHVEEGEPALIAAIREAKEEVGVDVEAQDLRMVHVMHRLSESRDHERVDFGFEVAKWKGTPYNAEPDKCSELRWADPDDLPEHTIDVVALMFEHAKHGRVYSHHNF